MMKLKLKIWLLSAGLLAFSVNSSALNRLIIKYKLTDAEARMVVKNKLSTQQVNDILMQPLPTTQVSQISHAAGMRVKDSHAIGTGAHVLILEKNVTKDQLDNIINKIKQDPSVEYIEEDKIMKHMAPVNSGYQWDLMAAGAFMPNTGWMGDNFVNAWGPITNPGNGVTVAVIDTGYTPHPNFLSNLQPLTPGGNTYGYQFISDCRIEGLCGANTPDSQAVIPPKPNALDLGDFITTADANTTFFNGCTVSNSSWHGSHVTGTIIANGYDGSNNNMQIAGGAWGAKVIPVRVLGKCGGYTSDIINGVSWSVEQGVQVINMSLGGTGACSDGFQNAINQAVRAGVAVVVAAGNAGADVSTASPANCQNVISVSAKGPTNALAYYSNFGATTISASGGDLSIKPCDQGICGIYSTVWASQQAFIADQPTFKAYQGTSMAAPHVAAAVADIISFLRARGETSYTVGRITNILKSSAPSLSNSCNAKGCTTNALTLDVASAMNYIANNISLTPELSSMVFNRVNTPVTNTFTNPGAAVTLAGITTTGSFTVNPSSTCKQGITLNPGASCTVVISANSTSAAGTLKLQGSGSSVANADVALSTVTLSFQTPLVSPPPSSMNTGGGGGCTAIGGGDDFGLLLLLLSISAYAYYRKRSIHIR